MVKKVQDTDSDQSMTSAPQEGKSFDLYMVQYIIRALMMLIVFAWALVNLDAVLRFLNSVFALVSPFLIGGAIAFLMNIMLRPLERLWKRVFRKAPAKLTPTGVPDVKRRSHAWNPICRCVYDDSEPAGIGK